MNKIKVLHLFNEIKFSGGELMYVGAAKIFQDSGIEMLAFSTGKELGGFASEFTKNKIKVYHKPIKTGINCSLKTLKYYIDFYKYLKNEKIDVLHIHRNDLYMVALCSRLAGVRSIKTMHSVFRNKKNRYIFGYLKRLVARKLLKVTFQTIGKSVYENELGHYYNPSVRINNWYDGDRFFTKKNEKEKQEIRRSLNIKPDAFVIISVGGCTDNKNHSDIIKALEIVNKKTDCIYLHLGKGITEKKEEKLATDLGIEEKVFFIGNKHNVRDYLIASDVYVMSSKFEGLTIAGIEAMACGLPSILYNSPGLRDLINNDDNGFLIDKNYKLLANKIIEFKENDNLRKEKGNAGNYFVNKNFSMKKNVFEIILLYKGLKSIN